MLYENLGVNSENHLTIKGRDTVELAGKYGTPLYVLDTDSVYESCLRYKALMAKYFGPDSFPLYASKAFSCKEIYRIVQRAGIGADVASGGEIYTAVAAGFPMEKAYFHGNNKTEADIRQALDCGVGCFAVDNAEELETLTKELGNRCQESGEKETSPSLFPDSCVLTPVPCTPQRIMLRLSPGIDPHTHKAVVTGSVDSKFGTAIATGQAMELVKRALSCKNLILEGLHCHIGSQILEYSPYPDAARIMIGFIAEIKKETGHTVGVLNLGGGFGVRYTEDDPEFDYEKAIADIAAAVEGACKEHGVEKPAIVLEPGRSIIAPAGVTLYTIGSFKTITGYKSYVSVDGGMPDNPRYALYQSKYSFSVANRADDPREVRATVAGRCCESGDLLQENAPLQRCGKGDILAVLGTGAYNYSMASNYNRIPRPPVLAIEKEGERLIIKRETYEDLIRNDV